MSHADVTDSLTNPVTEGGQEGSATFEFDEKDGTVEDLSRTSMEQAERIETSLGVQDSHIDQGITTFWLYSDVSVHSFTAQIKCEHVRITAKILEWISCIIVVNT